VTDTGGGPDKTILNSPRFLTPLGYRMLCAYMHPPRDPGFAQLQKKAEIWQAPLLSVQDRGAWDWRVAVRLARICRSERVAIWHGHDYKSNALGLLVRLFWPMRLVTTVHGWGKHIKRTPLYYAIDRLCLRYYERVICVSQDLYETCLAARVPARRCVLIENGIDMEEYSREVAVEQAKKRLGFAPERFLIGAAGRLSDEKGFDFLIRAADQLLKSGLDVELVIVGEGEERPCLEALIAELGRAERIHLLGYRLDLKDLYAAFDVFTLSSVREGLPNVLLESMALEVPVVSTRIAGIPRLIQHEENGLLIEPAKIDGLVGALTRLYTDRSLRTRLGQAGRQTIQARYSFQVRMQKIKALYDELLTVP
jgi:glycosyltransferase involved in cell wall biosynthesis